MSARRARFSLGLILGAILVMVGVWPVVGPLPRPAAAQGAPVSVTLYRDATSLTLYLPAAGTVSLAGLRFDVIQTTGTAAYRLQDFNLGLPLDALPTPLCLRLERAGSAAPLPLACGAAVVIDRPLADANVFWHDGRQAQPVLIYAGDQLAGIFGTEDAEVDLLYMPPLPTATPISPPTPTVPPEPPAQILFLLDASTLMTQPMGGRTRWDAALEQLSRLIARRDLREEIGILVYGPSRSYFEPDVVLGTPTDPCDDYEWRLRYQHPLNIDLPSIGLDAAIPPGGAVALERALFSPDGADLRSNPAVTTVVVLLGGLAPDDPGLGCNLTQRDLEEILYELDRSLAQGVTLELVGIAESALPIDQTYDNIRVWPVGSEDELSDTLELIVANAVERDTHNPNVSLLPELNAEQQAALRLTPTPMPPQRGTPLVDQPAQGPTPTAGPARIEASPTPNPTVAASPIPPVNSPSPVAPAPTSTPGASQVTAAPVNPACPAPRYGVVTTDDRTQARVRADSNLNSVVLDGLPYGTVITLCQERDGWYFIQAPNLPNGGWIYGGLLQVSTDPTAIFITATAALSITPSITPRPTDTPAPIEPTVETGGVTDGGGGTAGGGGGSSLSITGIDIGSGTGCSATIHVHVDGPAVSGNIHVWNAYYDSNGNVYPAQTFPSGDSTHGITLGGTSEEHKTHKVWITYGNNQSSNDLGGLVCNNWGS